MKRAFLHAAAMCGLAAVLAVAGCNNNDRMDDDDMDDASMGVINSRCPIMPAHGVADNPTTVEHNGYKVGFCCPGCEDDWEALSDEQKDAFVEQSLTGNMGVVGEAKASQCACQQK